MAVERDGSMIGRPRSLTRDVMDTIVNYLATGVSAEVAAQAAGITGRTFYNYQARSRLPEDDPDYDPAVVEFFQRVEEAKGRRQAMWAGTIVKAAQEGEWRAAQALLQAHEAGSWLTKNRTELSGPAGAPIQVQPVVEQPLDDENVKRMEAVMARSGLLQAPIEDAEVVDDDNAVEFPSSNGSNGNGQH